MNALVTPIEHVDVRGNKLLYLRIQGPNGEVVVNIGQKTYDGVAKILQPRETSTQLQILPQENDRNAAGLAMRKKLDA